MITKGLIKSEIDKMQDQYIEALYRIIKAFEYIPASKQDIVKTEISQNENEEWFSFVENTYGCLFEDLIERGEQGEFEVREVIH